MRQAAAGTHCKQCRLNTNMLKQALDNDFCKIMAMLCLLLIAAGHCTTIDKKEAPEDILALLPAYIKDSVYLWPGNPYTAAKANIGRYLFYDRRMSVNQSKSCASCHAPAFSFTDGYRRSIGALGDNVQHNARALINIVYNRYLTAADSTLHFPEQQINNPMFHHTPAELGWKGNEHIILARLRNDSLYRIQLPLLFPEDKDPFTTINIQRCISSFIKSIVALDAPYDRWIHRKDSTALTASQMNGMKLFFSDRLHCSSCHGGINFTTPGLRDENGQPAFYQNTGLYNINSMDSFPASDQGLLELTGQAADQGKFLVPTLRNLAFTAPYLHDGSAENLNDIITLYENGGRNISSGINRGDGRLHRNKNPLINGFAISPQEKKDLISFLMALSDSSVCTNPRYANPFTMDETHP